MSHQLWRSSGNGHKRNFGNQRPLVLIVDDDPMSRELLRDVVEGMGYAVEEAADGRDAHRALYTWRPDAVLLDIQLPFVDGIELIRTIRADPTLAQTPVVAVTAQAMSANENRARQAGVDEFLPKPIRVTRLRETIASLLRSRAEGPDS